MTSCPFVPTDFQPPTELSTRDFRLEPLGPQHNASDLAAWSGSIAHIRSTPGYPDGNWPPVEGMSHEENREDLQRHAADFLERKGFTFTVLDPVSAAVIGCVYLYPADTHEHDVSLQSWVRADRAHLDTPLAEAVTAWLRAAWPWKNPDVHGRW